MTTRTTNPRFAQWYIALVEGDKELWRHLDAMENGNEGGFNQSLFRAMSKADARNKERLYNAFSDRFNP